MLFACQFWIVEIETRRSNSSVFLARVRPLGLASSTLSLSNGKNPNRYKQMLKIFNPMAINVQRISLIHETLHFLHYFVRGVIYALIAVLSHFSVILQP